MARKGWLYFLLKKHAIGKLCYFTPDELAPINFRFRRAFTQPSSNGSSKAVTRRHQLGVCRIEKQKFT